ncbi:unnamed protein product [Colias eurytheme]|nr:unnamed protein product [Colias eurytheme]
MVTTKCGTFSDLPDIQKYTPKDEAEYRAIDRYLRRIEGEGADISWFSYSPEAERSVKVAVRGLPVNTQPDELLAALRELGYDPEFARPIRARKGRPGCLFLVILKKTPNLTPGIYDVSELMHMPGVIVEAWRSKRGPAQCHRCQGFRHSSHNCQKGGPHRAHHHPRTAAAHRAGRSTQRASSAARTHPAGAARRGAHQRPHGGGESRLRRPRKTQTGGTREKIPLAAPSERRHHSTPCRPARAHSAGNGAATAAGVTDRKRAVIRAASLVLQSVLSALEEGADPIPIVMQGLLNLLQK